MMSKCSRQLCLNAVAGASNATAASNAPKVKNERRVLIIIVSSRKTVVETVDPAGNSRFTDAAGVLLPASFAPALEQRVAAAHSWPTDSHVPASKIRRRERAG